jgi:hypothetical protein
MDMSKGPAAPASGTSPDLPTFEELAADPEIAALLDFEPVPMRPRVNGWDAEAQRAFVALVATTGSKLRAAEAIGRKTGGLKRMLERPEAAGLAAAIDAALALAHRRSGKFLARTVAAAHHADPHVQVSGQVLNEFGEWEDEDSFHRRGEEARDSLSIKLRRARRLFLEDISDDPAKRAAFEILTELPIDWEKAAQCLPQDDEPWRKPSVREPEMLLTAEAGWLGEFTHGPDKKAELLKEVNAWRAERGLEPVGWAGEGGTTGEMPEPF